MSRRKIKSKKKSVDVIPFSLPDRRLNEQTLAGLGGAYQAEDSRSMAQELVWEAFEQGNIKKRVSLAKEALAIYPDCVDAHNILAENSTSIQQAMEYYKKGVEAGERDLGKEAFKEDIGHFWGILETRPYMRALHGLAQCLENLGDKEAASVHFLRMLELNPNDNQGVREELVPLLIEMKKLNEAASILDRYEEDGFSSYSYNRALVLFGQQGNSEESRAALETAKKANKYVPDLLCGKVRMPKQLPEYHKLGDKTEAVSYVHFASTAWSSVLGALDWIQQ